MEVCCERSLGLSLVVTLNDGDDNNDRGGGYGVAALHVYFSMISIKYLAFLT